MTREREPLMLSDTAMVLLRRYPEIFDYDPSPREVSEDIEPLSDEERDAFIIDHGIRFSLMSEVHGDLLLEICALWKFPDGEPRRTLDWHLVFDDELMYMAEQVFADPHPWMPLLFMERLMNVYYEIYRARRQRPSDKDGS